jgi:ABC-type transporter Mla MlaB component
LLEISVAVGEAGPVLTLSGEADLTTVAELTGALSAQLAAGARHLTVDLSRLRFADSAVIRELVLAGRQQDAGGDDEDQAVEPDDAQGEVEPPPVSQGARVRTGARRRMP